MWVLVVAIFGCVATSGCFRLGFEEVEADGRVATRDGIDAAPIDPVADWADPSFPYRYRVPITNDLGTDRVREPIFLDGASFTGGPEPIRETALRLVCRDGELNVDMPFAVHDWSSDVLPLLDDSDGDLDADDRLLFLLDLPANGTVDCFVYYDVVDRDPIGFPAVSVTPVAGGAFSRVTVDGVTANATALRVADGVNTFDLELAPSIPLWNQSSTYTY
ncbi:MAG: hypothetical protein KJO07_08925, partial [Deltaproteobacteria bacterium]|nr:hypothetical protein [Deltaproteobacteria bacterium]